MIDRIVEIANPARLSVRDAQLVIESGKEDQLSLPFMTPVSEIRSSAAGTSAYQPFPSRAVAHC